MNRDELLIKRKLILERMANNLPRSQEYRKARLEYLAIIKQLQELKASVKMEKAQKKLEREKIKKEKEQRRAEWAKVREDIKRKKQEAQEMKIDRMAQELAQEGRLNSLALRMITECIKTLGKADTPTIVVTCRNAGLDSRRVRRVLFLHENGFWKRIEINGVKAETWELIS